MLVCCGQRAFRGCPLHQESFKGPRSNTALNYVPFAKKKKRKKKRSDCIMEVKGHCNIMPSKEEKWYARLQHLPAVAHLEAT